MKKRTYKYIGIGGVFILVISIFCFCYYRVNTKVPLQYKVDKYEKDEVIKLDDLEVTLNKFEKLEGKKSAITNENRYNYILNFTIKNTSNEDKPLADFYYGSSLINDKNLFFQNLSEEVKNKSEDYEYILKSQEKKEIKITYNTFKDLGDIENLEFYFSHDLYENEIKKELDNLIMYDKCISLF